MLEITATLKSNVDATAFQDATTHLHQLTEQVQQSKQNPPAKVIGDWQSTETLYAVVDRPLFDAWRQHVQQWIFHYYEENEALVYGFDEYCRFPHFVEFLEGQKFVNALLKSLA